MFDELLRNIDLATIDISTLNSDVERMIASENKGEDPLKAPRSTIEPLTRIRKDVSEVNAAKEDPAMQFIVDKINDSIQRIVGG